MADLEESPLPIQSHRPESTPEGHPYTAEITDPGCAHCGSGKHFRIVGPGIEADRESSDHYIGWSDGMIQDEVDRLNRLYTAIRQHATSSGEYTK